LDCGFANLQKPSRSTRLDQWKVICQGAAGIVGLCSRRQSITTTGDPEATGLATVREGAALRLEARKDCVSGDPRSHWQTSAGDFVMDTVDQDTADQFTRALRHVVLGFVCRDAYGKTARRAAYVKKRNTIV
jgi:hypothetical protein